MAYERQNFKDGDVLSAAQLNHIEDGIVAALTTSPVRLDSIMLLQGGWKGESSPYSQVVTIDGTTQYSKVDLLPSVAQLATFHDLDISFVTENDGGVITVYAIGDKPPLGFNMQVQITEVQV